MCEMLYPLTCWLLTHLLGRAPHWCPCWWWWPLSLPQRSLHLHLWPAGPELHYYRPPPLTSPPYDSPLASQRSAWNIYQCRQTLCCDIVDKCRVVNCAVREKWAEAYLNSSLAAFGMMPCWESCTAAVWSSDREPIIVCVFPLPVWPYAMIHTLYLKWRRDLFVYKIDIFSHFITVSSLIVIVNS